MPKIITEDMIEQAAVKTLQERYGYTVLNCITEIRIHFLTELGVQTRSRWFCRM